MAESNKSASGGPLFINTLQKRAKKTNFSADPNFVSRQRGILGCGCHPLFIKSGLKIFYKVSS
jgi:hypothetical protein